MADETTSKLHRARRRSSRSSRRSPRASPAPSASRTTARCITPAPDTDLVLKTDPVAEGVHFLASDAPQDIAWKALAVNASDIAAKGARPLGYLMALSFPNPPRLDWMRALPMVSAPPSSVSAAS